MFIANRGSYLARNLMVWPQDTFMLRRSRILRNTLLAFFHILFTTSLYSSVVTKAFYYCFYSHAKRCGMLVEPTKITHEYRLSGSRLFTLLNSNMFFSGIHNGRDELEQSATFQR